MPSFFDSELVRTNFETINKREVLFMIDVRSEFARFNSIMPIKSATVKGEAFPYRYYKNEHPEKDVTLIFLAGCTGLADAVFLLFR